MRGLFGKMPSHGDFVSKGFSPTLVDALDTFYRAVLSTVASECDDVHGMLDAAPPTMLSIRPGAICDAGFFGIVIPSRDRVGRAFPLCVGAEVAASQPKIPMEWPSGAVSAVLLNSVRTALDGVLGPEDMFAALNALPDWDQMSAGTTPFAVSSDDTVPRFRGNLDNCWFQGPPARMGAGAIAQCARLAWDAVLLGVTLDHAGHPADFFATKSLLSWSPMAATFDQRWEHWGWSTHFLEKVEPPVATSGSVVLDDNDITRPRMRST
jgi:type VI secretion system protein ImpM